MKSVRISNRHGCFGVHSFIFHLLNEVLQSGHSGSSDMGEFSERDQWVGASAFGSSLPAPLEARKSDSISYGCLKPIQSVILVNLQCLAFWLALL